MSKIFVSYSRSDKPFLDDFLPLVETVYKKGNIWYDNDIHGGTDWWQIILNAIANHQVFVYLISNESLTSSYCQAELREALRLQKQVLPVIVRRLSAPYPNHAPDDLRPVLAKLQYIDFSGGFKSANVVASLYASLNGLLAISTTVVSLSSQPISQPPVLDKPKDSTITAAYIGGWFLLIGVILAGIFGLWQGYFSNNSTNPDSTTEVLQVLATHTPESVAQVNTPSAYQQLQTLEAAQTATSLAATANAVASATVFAMRMTENAAALLLTSTAQIATDTIGATETIAASVLIALSWTPSTIPTAGNTPPPTSTATNTSVPPTASSTPTLSPTLDPLEDALHRASIPVTRNTDWIPFERDFDGIPMVLVPAGCFQMGTTNEELQNTITFGGIPAELVNERPAHRVCFEPFWIDKTEVTNAQYGSPGTWDSPNMPRDSVNWYSANNYCQNRGTRLPTEAEWEYAARGVDGWTFPWGNTWNSHYAVWRETEGNAPLEVGSLPAGRSWIGSFDMSGNLWEWVNTSYGYDELGDGDIDFQDTNEFVYIYPYATDDGREQIMHTSTLIRVLRGGSYRSGAVVFLRSQYRSYTDPANSNEGWGFRCVKDINQS